ncbi:substrate-binding periplasmic protein [Limimonas halophila]|uniref:substrate-binding periplasmic protein n=1 Tax=Limimonas halophila TaxID=1082479 RepID=UPI00115FDD0D|nr:transporter substrate-binding domain-containing protein [Limimonas halophila]
MASAILMAAALAAAPAHGATIRLVTNPWPPVQGPSMPEGGPSPAIIKAAAKAAGHTAEVTFMPWKRAKAMARAGSYDGLLAAWYTEARDRHYAYTQPYYSMRVGLMAHETFELRRYETLARLRGHRIGVLEGWGYPKPFKTAAQLDKVRYPNPEAAVDALLRDRVELVAMVESVFRHHAARMGAEPSAYRMLHPALMTPDLHVALSEKNPEAERLARALTRGLRRIKANGTYARILGRYGAMRQLSER